MRISHLENESGFSLAELLIYIGILGVVSGVLVGILNTVTKTQVQESAQNDVTGQLNFTMQTIQRLVRDSSLIQLDAGVATSTLKLRMVSLANDPTLVYLQNGQVYVQQGTGAALTITSDKVNVDSLQFKKFSQPPGRDIVQVDLSISEVQPAAGQTISRALRSAFARVNAAVFDSDLLPNTDNTWSVGANPSTRWLNGAFSGALTVGGNVGIGTTGPVAPLNVYSGTTSNPSLTSDTGQLTNYQVVSVQLASGVITTGPWTYWMQTKQSTQSGSTFPLALNPLGGNVGIGTTNPGVQLDVSATSTNTAMMALEQGGSGGAAASFYQFGSPTGAGQTYTAYRAGSKYNIGTASTIGGAISPVLTIDSSGNVGIGTTGPGNKLEISGNGGTGLRLTHSSYNYWDVFAAYEYTNADLIFKSFGTERMRMDSSGQLCIGYNGAQGCTGSAGLLVNGNVGIGTTTPSGKLDLANNRIVNVSTPINSTDVANKAYVDAASGGKTPTSTTFTSSGTWTQPTGVNLVWVSMVGGGGGGGYYCNGGGGGGGGQSIINYPVAVSGNVTVTIGSGGAGGTLGGGGNGSNGGNTSFGSLVASGGGGAGQTAGQSNCNNPVSSAYGGGGGGGNNGGCVGGGQNNLSSGDAFGSSGGGGGGGYATANTYGEAGGNAGAYSGGAGAKVVCSTTYYGAGGGGASSFGNGGAGGGGAGGNYGGGGGGNNGGAGGNGASGLVIVQWWQ